MQGCAADERIRPEEVFEQGGSTPSESKIIPSQQAKHLVGLCFLFQVYKVYSAADTDIRCTTQAVR
jgi:hypothetical protein